MRTMKKRILGVFVLAVVLILAMAFTACEGPEGPMGPQGPAGGTDPNCEHLWWTSWVYTETSTCTTGEIKRVCQGCLKRETETQPLGHTVANFNMSTQPTETADGQGTWDCTRTGCTTPSGNSVTIPAWNKFYGTWVDSSSATITISSNEYVWKNSSNAIQIRFTDLVWTPTVINGLGAYSFSGTRDTSGEYGNTYMVYWLSADGQSLLRGGSNVYNKQ